MPYDICMHPWLYYQKPFKMVGNLYYIGSTDVSTHLIAGKEGLILIDSGFPQTVYQLLENIRILGFDPADIKTIIHTHAHYDHCGGTKAIVGLTGAKTYLGKGDAEIIENDHSRTWADEYGLIFYEQFDIDVFLNDGDEIECGDIVVRCVSAPGHTSGTMAVFFDVSENGRLYHAGLHGGPGLNTLSMSALEKRGQPLSNRDDYLASLEKLKKIPVDVIMGAHPYQTDTLQKTEKVRGGENPFIDPDAWKRYLNDLESNAKELFTKD